jgi:hypothetical protein
MPVEVAVVIATFEGSSTSSCLEVIFFEARRRLRELNREDVESSAISSRGNELLQKLNNSVLSFPLAPLLPCSYNRCIEKDFARLTLSDS